MKRHSVRPLPGSNVKVNASSQAYAGLEDNPEIIEAYRANMEPLVSILLNEYIGGVSTPPREYRRFSDNAEPVTQTLVPIYLASVFRRATNYNISFIDQNRKQQNYAPAAKLTEDWISLAHANFDLEFIAGQRIIKNAESKIMATTVNSPVTTITSIPAECLHVALREITLGHVNDALQRYDPPTDGNGQLVYKGFFAQMREIISWEEAVVHSIVHAFKRHANTVYALGITEQEFFEFENYQKQQYEYRNEPKAAAKLRVGATPHELIEIYRHEPQKIFKI